MGVDAVTILVDDEEIMHQAADCALRWLNRQPEHTAGTKYAFIVQSTPDGRVTITGVPVEVLPEIRRAGIEFEVLPEWDSKVCEAGDQGE